MAGRDASNWTPRKICCLGAVSILAASAAFGQAPPQAPRSNAPAAQTPAASQVLAVVNNEQITRQAMAIESLRRYGKIVLQNLIHKQVIWQACQQKNVVVTRKEIEDEIQKTANKLGVPIDQWLLLLKSKRKIDPNKYRSDIIWPMLAMRKMAAQNIQVAPEELQKAFESKFGPKVQVRMIASATQQRAQELLAEAKKNPAEFGKIAKLYSIDRGSASVYGMIPPISKHIGAPSLNQAAFALQPQQISNVIPVGDQFVVLKCEKHLPQMFLAGQNLETAKTALRGELFEQKVRRASAKMLQDLKQNTRVVNVYEDPQLQKQYPQSAALVGNEQITLAKLSEECLLRHGEDVLNGEINRRLLVQSLQKRRQQVTRADLDAEIRRAAEAYGYLTPAGQPDVAQWRQVVTEKNGITAELYENEVVWPSVALKKLVRSTVQVTDEDLRKGYEANYGERVRVQVIVFDNQRTAQKVWAMARDNNQAANAKEAFGELANRHSVEDVSRASFGEVPPIQKHSGQPLLEKEAFKLQPGELSGILGVGGKYVVMRCLGRTTPVATNFNEVREQLRKGIFEKKLQIEMQEEFDRIKEGALIVNYLTGERQTGASSAPPKVANPPGTSPRR